MTLHCFATERVERRLPSGSSGPVLVQTAGGRFIAKLRGAGHGVSALIAEIIVAELAEILGLPVPERALIELLPTLQSDDRNDELADLLRRSIGLNLGFRWLEAARQPSSEYLRSLDDDFVARVLWLDGLTMNPDRTDKNPNLLVWKGRPWLIDHGAALTFHHNWELVTEQSPRESVDFSTHVFEHRHALLREFDAKLADAMSREALEAAIAKVPDAFLASLAGSESAVQSRRAYHAFLWKRLKAPRPFVPGS
jgi:hypothetical protein